MQWGDLKVGNCWRFKYLSSIFQADGAQMPDVRARIGMASTCFGKLRHIWTAGDLHLNLRMRLYKACICSILTYGSEAWRITPEVAAALNGANARMVSVITGRTPHQEASAKWRTFDLVRWVRARRLSWAGHILRMEGTDRLLKRAVFGMFKDPQPGDLLMDAPRTTSWRELQQFAMDRDYWNTRVRAMTQPRVAVDMEPEMEPGGWAPFTISY